jgi:hypothetical protein
VAASGAEVKREDPDRAIDQSAELGVAFVNEVERLAGGRSTAIGA